MIASVLDLTQLAFIFEAVLDQFDMVCICLRLQFVFQMLEALSAGSTQAVAQPSRHASMDRTDQMPEVC